MMGYLDQLLQLPYAYVWVPGLVFFAIVGGAYWLISKMPKATGPQLVVEPQIINTPPPEVLTPKSKDQRNTSRRQGNPVEVYVAPPEKKDDPAIGSVLDRSMGGMRLALFNEVAVGAVIAIRPTHADDMVPWVELEVRSCKPSKEMPGQFEVGCQYVKSPPYSIQLLFG